ncbi:hypothetical protein JQT98_10265 [Ponticoccus sp. SC6-69]|nr:hypothetical protein [Ponticoccus sp. SC6-9]MBM1224803.1 hypothetical protein [Ponticoccus sp. SC6-15]MBM1228316.1 hypothetical protein [Ponticoccus sp. SC6-38]MBM1234046.1 hypothetical protein [Ponticoccus sp. SC6-45]MBM1251771.1 hypothetical protein [Ponticoccus sp. SC6-33]MBM1279365.1 hypothetical protein [Ponticoccus sp. SC6-36]MBM1288106.1 hypothetical protein [Ponticoccus sp. SC6-69]MBM1317479.1 hypothetical protein [Ponticoccus sp. SC2-22]MBM1330661.1 hypothetical protein [Pontico
MILELPVNAARAATRRFVPLILASALALSACVPIPYASGTKYMPLAEDITVPNGDSGGCGFGADWSTDGYREFGPVRVSVGIEQPSEDEPGAGTTLVIQTTERSRTGEFQTVSVNTALVRLEENGRSYPARFVDPEVRPNYSSDRFRQQVYRSEFPRGTGIAANVRLVFGEGAVTINGRPVEYPPVRFKRRETVSVYLFPCLPT